MIEFAGMIAISWCVGLVLSCVGMWCAFRLAREMTCSDCHGYSWQVGVADEAVDAPLVIRYFPPNARDSEWWSVIGRRPCPLCVPLVTDYHEYGSNIPPPSSRTRT